jgi:hypothetical protein
VTGGAPLQIRFTGADLPRLRLRVGAAVVTLMVHCGSSQLTD